MNADSFSNQLYQKVPQMVLGFHGCDQSTVDRILCSHTEHLTRSENDYDWLGNGIYFWLNDPQRAYEWAEQTHKKSPDKIRNPAVIGAVIDLGTCLNLCERESIILLKESYKDLISHYRGTEIEFLKRYSNKREDEGGFAIIRKLDCAVINNLHEMLLDEDDSGGFDTVYGYFQEGADAFPGAGIKEKSHIQIAVRNIECIKGYFLPRKLPEYDGHSETAL